MIGADALLPSGETKCLNCGEVLSGVYCHACGQKSGAPPLHFHDFVHDLVHEFLHFDSKIWRTLKLLVVSPGTLTRELLAGRRARYVGPVRLFLVWSVILFGLLASTAEYAPPDGDRQKITAQAEADLDRKMAEVGADRFKLAVMNAVRRGLQNPERVTEGVIGALSRSAFLLVPIFAFVTWKFFGKQQAFYVGHMYFALHFHAFAFIVLSAITLLSLAHAPLPISGLTAFAASMLVYFYFAIRRAVQASWAKALLAGSLVIVICSALNAVVIGLFVLGTVLLL